MLGCFSPAFPFCMLQTCFHLGEAIHMGSKHMLHNLDIAKMWVYVSLYDVFNVKIFILSPVLRSLLDDVKLHNCLILRPIKKCLILRVYAQHIFWWISHCPYLLYPSSWDLLILEVPLEDLMGVLNFLWLLDIHQC